MNIYIGFDDTDTLDSDFGTGKVVRWFEKLLPDGAVCQGVVRQQLLVCDEIPYTSHNSSACMVLEVSEESGTSGFIKDLVDLASDHVVRRAADGSDPGLCLVTENNSSLSDIQEFGYKCTHRVSTQKEALRAVNGGFIAGLGGSNDGLIGAAAAVGLTASGWSGRYIEYKNLRQLPETMSVSALNERKIQVISMDRDARIPSPEDLVLTNGWIRPLRLGHQPVLIVTPKDGGLWETIHARRNKRATL